MKTVAYLLEDGHHTFVQLHPLDEAIPLVRRSDAEAEIASANETGVQMYDLSQAELERVRAELGTVRAANLRMGAEIAQLRSNTAPTLVGYVIKVGDEYAVGNGSARTKDRRGAFVFRDGRSSVYPDAKHWAWVHRDGNHEGGRIVRVVRRGGKK